MRIIQANNSHVEQIMEVWKGFVDYHQRIDPYYGARKGAHLQFGEYIKSRMEREDSQVLVAMDGERLLGYCLCYVHDRAPVFAEKEIGILSDLAVNEADRGAGVGGALVEASIAWFRTRGIKRIELRTSAMNVPSIEFYQKHGFWIYDHMMTREI